MVTVVAFEFSVMRCQPLRRALGIQWNNGVTVKVKLYKYVPFSDGAKAIIRDGTLKFSSRLEFNDPFDCIARFNKKKTLNELSKREPILRGIMKNRNLSVEERFRAKKIAANEMSKLIESNYFDSMADQLGICCLSKVYDNILMWSHYADKHQGIVIEFSTEQLHEKNSHNSEYSLLGFDVDYSPTMPEVGNVLVNDFERDVKPLIFTKAIDWKYEEEFRVVSNNRGVGIHKFDQNLITRVFTGVNFSQDNLDELECLVRNLREKTNNTIPIVPLKKSDSQYSLVHA
ncbi:DUF2971 domain-containing protein [Vibrio cholerae]|nr:DUF2971 domain-containing protein [Vibrio cholerae]